MASGSLRLLVRHWTRQAIRRAVTVAIDRLDEVSLELGIDDLDDFDDELEELLGPDDEPRVPLVEHDSLPLTFAGTDGQSIIVIPNDGFQEIEAHTIALTITGDQAVIPEGIRVTRLELDGEITAFMRNLTTDDGVTLHRNLLPTKDWMPFRTFTEETNRYELRRYPRLEPGTKVTLEVGVAGKGNAVFGVTLLVRIDEP